MKMSTKIIEAMEVLAGWRGAKADRAVRVKELAAYQRTFKEMEVEQRAALNRLNLLIDVLGNPSDLPENADAALIAAAAAAALAGLGGNHVPNSDFLDGLTHWAAVGGLGSEITWDLRPGGEAWSGPETPTMSIYQDGNSAQTTLVRMTGEDAEGNQLYGIHSAPDAWYQISANISSHRCVANLYVRWVDENGAELSRDLVASLDSVPGPSDNPEAWGKAGAVLQAPAGTAYRQLEFEKEPTEAGQADSYAFLYHPFSVSSREGAPLKDYSPGRDPIVTAPRLYALAVTTPKIADNGVTQVNSANAQNLAFTGTGKPIIVVVVFQCNVSSNEGGSGILRVVLKNNGVAFRTAYYHLSQNLNHVTLVGDDVSIEGTTTITVEGSNTGSGGTASISSVSIIVMETKK